MISEGTLLTAIGIGLGVAGSVVNDRKQDLRTDKAVEKYMEKKGGKQKTVETKKCRFRKRKEKDIEYYMPL